MNHKKKYNDEDTMRPEYDFDMSKAVRGKYYKRLMEEGANVVTIQPDVFEVFPDSESVNEALRSLIELSKKAGAAKARRKKRPTTVASRVVKD
jgi:hypothetical protein